MARLSEEKIQQRIDDLATRGITVLSREYRPVSGKNELYFNVQCQYGHAFQKKVLRNESLV
jgi:hypothetical protein